MTLLSALLDQYAVADRLEIKPGPGGLTALMLSAGDERLTLTLHGAHVCSYSVDGQEVLWLSDDSEFTSGKAIRGGIPLCFPWFGPHKGGTAPQHGYARLSEFSIDKVEVADNTTRVQLILKPEAVALPEFKNDFEIKLDVTIGEGLSMTLKAKNTSGKATEVSAALHSYFEIPDISKADIPELHGLDYLDKTDNMSLKHQNGPFNIQSETDTVFLDVPAQVNLSCINRKVQIYAQGHKNFVVWNPGKDKATAMADFSQARYKSMICIEPAIATGSEVVVEAGEEITISQVIQLIS